MLVYLKVNNCFIYSSQVEFSMQADMRYKRFPFNTLNFDHVNVLKTAILIGPNNTGKTNFVQVVDIVKHVLLNQRPLAISKNFYSKSSVCEISVSFLDEGRQYVYEFKYDTNGEKFLYEHFYEVERDSYGNSKNKDILIRDVPGDHFICLDRKARPIIKIASQDNILAYLINLQAFPHLEAMKKALVSFASKIDIIDMNNIPIEKTIGMMKFSEEEHKKIANFVKNADLDLDDFCYVENDKSKNHLRLEIRNESKPQEEVLLVKDLILEVLNLVSVYRGIRLPSLLYDSTGTKKAEALAGFVIDALENGRILVVDELDSSLHFRLTRGIIAMFNNELNTKAQMIATVHDVSLLDCRTLFRKDQIWFAHKDKERAYLYSLSNFKAQKDKVRSTDDLIEKYKRGFFGALPEPDLFKSLLEVTKDVKHSAENSR